MSQRNLSHASHPIGGVLISPLSRASVPKDSTDANRSSAKCIPAKTKQWQVIQMLELWLSNIKW